MNLERLKMLEHYAKEDPTDPFPIYALALEWVKTNPNKAMDLFDQLLANHSDYLPVYYHAGQVNLVLGNTTKARQILETGIVKAKKSGESKTLAELQTLLGDIGH